MKDENELGATGNFPDGKLDESNEGELRIAIGIHENEVVINFEKPVTWIGFPKDLALSIGQSIINYAEKLP